MKKAKLIGTCIFAGLMVISLIALGIYYLTVVKHPYKEVEGEYQMYVESLVEGEIITLDGTEWTYKDESGEFVYQGKDLYLYASGADESIPYISKPKRFTGTIENGVAFLKDSSGRNYCFCLEGKTPSIQQEVSINSTSTTWKNYTEDEGDDIACCNVTGIGTYYTPNVVIPEAYNGKPVYIISKNAFSGHEWITSIKIPGSVRVVSAGAFTGSGAIKSEGGVKYVDNWVIGIDSTATAIELRAGTVGIADEAFENATALKSVKLPASVKYIGTGAFSGCTALETVELNEGLETINESAFAKCSALKKIVIPASVKYVGPYTFYGCDKAIDIRVMGSSKAFGENWRGNEED